MDDASQLEVPDPPAPTDPDDDGRLTLPGAPVDDQPAREPERDAPWRVLGTPRF